jgi:hypothetical protein
MGLFGNDQDQDARLDAIEEWLQGLTGVVQQHRLDTAELRLELMKLQAQVGEKLEAGDFDPAVLQLSDKIAEARVVAKQAADAVEEGWMAIQKNAMNAMEELSEKLENSADRPDDD